MPWSAAAWEMYCSMSRLRLRPAALSSALLLAALHPVSAQSPQYPPNHAGFPTVPFTNGGSIEIAGDTDNVGAKDTNYKIGLDRAEAVKRYLYETQQIPLHKINVISYGEEKPIAPNKTKAGRAQNRRVVIKVLA